MSNLPNRRALIERCYSSSVIVISKEPHCRLAKAKLVWLITERMMMSAAHEIRTERLLLRRWRPADREPFAALNADPRVMKHFPGTLSRQESDALVERAEAAFQQNGFGPWAAEIPNVVPLIGFVGLSVPGFKAHFTPCVEIGWRLAADYWNRGYATEAAGSALKAGFETFQLEEIVAFTVPANLPSRRVMEKIGMTHHDADDFDHPLLPDGHLLKRHVLYRISRPVR